MILLGRERDDLQLRLGLKLYDMGMEDFSKDWIHFSAADHLNATLLQLETGAYRGLIWYQQVLTQLFISSRYDCAFLAWHARHCIGIDANGPTLRRASNICRS